MLLFSNNAETTLAVALPGYHYETDLVAVANGTADAFATPTDGSRQLATLTDTSLPGVFEVVAITARSGAAFTVVRGVELPVGAVSLPDWPVGAKLSARVTAGTLEAFAQSSVLGAPVTAANADGSTFTFSSLPLLVQYRNQPATGQGGGALDRRFAPEVSGWSYPVDLGVPATWTSSPLGISKVVVPPTPNGNQYWFDPSAPSTSSQTYTNVVPDFDNEYGVVPAYVGNAPDQQQVGHWVATPMPVLVSSFFGGEKLVVSEVGFIAFNKTSTANPIVNIGDRFNVTRFMNGLPLDQITGSSGIHRLPVTAGGELADGLKFSVVTPAAGGSFRGRFYWRGFFVNTYE